MNNKERQLFEFMDVAFTHPVGKKEERMLNSGGI